MKQAYALRLVVIILVAGGCSSGTDPDPARPSRPSNAPTTQEPASTPPPQAASPGEDAVAQSRPSEATHPGATEGELLDATLAQNELDALHEGARALVADLVGAFSRGDLAGAEAKLISQTAFDEIVAPGFRGILGGGLLAKNREELANLIEALRGRTIESWRWKPGKLVETKPQSAFSRPVVQITGGTIELEVEGTYVAVRLDQIVRLESGWTIFQLHNP